jgi:hypothetical protein
MTAKEAKSITKSMLLLNEIKTEIVRQPRNLQTTWREIISAIENGDNYCKLDSLPKNVKVALDFNKFKIEHKQEENGNGIFIVSWNT